MVRLVEQRRSMMTEELANSEAIPGAKRELTVPEAMDLAMKLHRQGQREAAEAVYRAVLEAVPDHPDALNFLGVLSDQEGRSVEAERLIRRALERVPDYPDFVNNLGNVLKGAGRLQEAEAAYRKVLGLEPDHPGALNNLGVVLKAQGRLEEAVATLQTTVARWPEHSGAHLNLGNALLRLGRIREAVAFHLEAIALNPNLTNSLKLRIYALRCTGRRAEALKLIDGWLVSEPESAAAHHLRAAISGEGVPDRASDRFVTETFDNFAAHFDELLRNLAYRAPEILAEAVAEELPPPGADLDVADAGCGTGLCGPLLRPFARNLVGIDLSPAMVERARQRGVYDELVTAELTEFFSTRHDEYDLIVSADTLCYFGALESIFAAAAGALRGRGRFTFTLERIGSESAPRGFFLEHHGRYRHTESYVRACLSNAGLEVRAFATAALRMEAGEPVEGLVVLARKHLPDSTR